MSNIVDFSGRPFHFIGIGGIGMSAIAHVLARRQIPLSGSDVHLNHITQRLSDDGVHIFLKQDPSNLEFFKSAAPSVEPSSNHGSSNGLTSGYSRFQGSLSQEVSVDAADRGPSRNSQSPSGTLSTLTPDRYLPQVVCSTAINTSNSEYRAALELGCPILHRSDVLAALIGEQNGIAVAGTHGKTTTSSMIGYLLLKANLDPTIIVGGEVDAWDGNARLGEGPYLVAEADESDGSLVKFAPALGIITNIELDHPDHYNSLDEVITTFKTFAQRCTTVIACLDCLTVQQEIHPNISYALSEDLNADYTARNLSCAATYTTADVFEQGHYLGELKLKLLGRHNLSNALAAVAVGRHLGLPFDQIADILATFEGAHRRFERKGEYCQITFIDDYAHHPSELRATLAAARYQASHRSSDDARRRIVAVFQPHRYSRTMAFLDEFGHSFQDADIVVTSDIYSAGEPNTHQVTGESLAEAIASHHPAVFYQPHLSDIANFLRDTLKSGDLVLFLGAGNLNSIIPDLLQYFQEKEDQIQHSSLCKPAS